MSFYKLGVTPSTPMNCSTLPPTTPPARRPLVPFSTTSRTSTRKMRPAEGGNAKINAPAKKQKWGRKGKKQAPSIQRGPGQAEDSDEAFIAAPDRKGPRGPPRGGGGLFDDMLKKPCPYHKGSVDHTLEQYYNRVAHRDEDKKKDAGDKGGDDEFPPVENAFFIFAGPTTNMTSR